MVLVGFLATVYVIYMLIKEALEEPAPKGTYFDWDEYYKDIRDGIEPMAQIRKQEKGGYMKVRKDNNN